MISGRASALPTICSARAAPSCAAATGSSTRPTSIATTSARRTASRTPSTTVQPAGRQREPGRVPSAGRFSHAGHAAARARARTERLPRRRRQLRRGQRQEHRVAPVDALGAAAGHWQRGCSRRPIQRNRVDASHLWRLRSEPARSAVLLARARAAGPGAESVRRSRAGRPWAGRPSAARSRCGRIPTTATSTCRNPHQGFSEYHALLLSAEKRLTNGFVAARLVHLRAS